MVQEILELVYFALHIRWVVVCYLRKPPEYVLLFWESLTSDSFHDFCWSFSFCRAWGWFNRSVAVQPNNYESLFSVVSSVCCWAPARPLLIIISCLWGAQQETGHTPLPQSNDRTDRRTPGLFIDPAADMLAVPMKPVWLFAAARCHQYAVLDHAFYDDKALSLLLLESDSTNGRSALVLLPTTALTEADSSSICSKVSLGSPRETLSVDRIW